MRHPHTQRILAATDFSEHAMRAKKRAAMLCEQLGDWTLELLAVREERWPGETSVAPDGASMVIEKPVVEKTLNVLKRICIDLQDDYWISFATFVRFGRPVAEIIARADEAQAELIVVGAHGSDYIGDLFLGNVADTLLRLTTRPLLIVKNEPVNCYREVLIPVDFSPDSKRAAELALRIAPQAHVTFLHTSQVWFESQMLQAGVPQAVIRQYRNEAADEARRSLDLFIGDLKPAPHSYSRVIEFGSPVEVISDYAEGIHPDLIAIGKYGEFEVQERILGSVTRRAANRAFCDVLIATAEDGTKEHHQPDGA